MVQPSGLTYLRSKQNRYCRARRSYENGLQRARFWHDIGQILEPNLDKDIFQPSREEGGGGHQYAGCLIIKGAPSKEPEDAGRVHCCQQST
jgi:hypothetical protein